MLNKILLLAFLTTACGSMAPPKYSKLSANNVLLWKKGVVPYEISKEFKKQKKELLRDAMDQWESVANVKFVPRTNEANYVFIQQDEVNMSDVGMFGGQQFLYLTKYFPEYIAMHELGHVLGMQHEQQRPDRDLYVKIVWDNIEDGEEHNFWMLSWLDFPVETKYDVDSIMQYDPYSFCKDEDKPTIILINPDEKGEIWENTELSEGDKIEMELMYPFEGQK